MQQSQIIQTAAGPLTIKRAQHPEDFATALAILDEAAQWLTSRGIDQWRAGQFQRTVTQGDVYLALLDGRPVATVALQWTERFDRMLWEKIADVEEAGYVHRIAVSRACGGKDVGRALLRWAEEMAAAAGKTYLRLDCSGENAELCAYYERAGFTPRGVVQGKSWSARLYEKRIAAQDS